MHWRQAAVSGLQAIENGAAAFLGPETDRASSSESSSLSIPVIQLPDPWEALGRLGAAFYNEPSQKMTVVGITGQPLPAGCPPLKTLHLKWRSII